MAFYKDGFLGHIQSNYTLNKHTRVVGVHVRRGDYLKSNNKGVLTAEYYLEGWHMLRLRLTRLEASVEPWKLLSRRKSEIEGMGASVLKDATKVSLRRFIRSSYFLLCFFSRYAALATTHTTAAY